MAKARQSGWDRVEILEKELAELRAADQHDATVLYLLASADTLVKAAKVLLEIREKREGSPQVEA